MNPREQFQKETGMTTGIMFARSAAFRDEYVLWLEKLVESLRNDAGYYLKVLKWKNDTSPSNPEPTREELVEMLSEMCFCKSKECSRCGFIEPLKARCKNEIIRTEIFKKLNS